MQELEEIRRPSAFLWHKSAVKLFHGHFRLPTSLNPNGEKWARKTVRSLLNVTAVAEGSWEIPARLLRNQRLPDFAIDDPQVQASRATSSKTSLHPLFFPQTFILYAAALIRGNRNNCTQFSRKLDWLVSKLERLESSSGKLAVRALQCYKMTVFRLFWQLKILSAISQGSWKSSTVSWLRVPRLWTSFRELTLNL